MRRGQHLGPLSRQRVELNFMKKTILIIIFAFLLTAFGQATSLYLVTTTANSSNEHSLLIPAVSPGMLVCGPDGTFYWQTLTNSPSAVGTDSVMSSYASAALTGSLGTGNFTNSNLFTTSTSAGKITILSYVGTSPIVSIPPIINCLPVTAIGSGSLISSIISNVTIPEGVTTIAGNAFNGSPVSRATFPTTLTSIGTSAFYMCAFTTVTFSSGSLALSGISFGNISSLTDVYFLNNAPTGVNPSTFLNASVTLHYLPWATGFTSPTWNGYACTSGTVTASGTSVISGSAALSGSAAVSGSATYPTGQYPIIKIEMPKGYSYTDFELKASVTNFAISNGYVFFFMTASLGYPQTYTTIPKVWFTDSSFTGNGEWSCRVWRAWASGSTIYSQLINHTSGQVGAIIVVPQEPQTILSATNTHLIWSYNLLSSGNREVDSAGNPIWRPTVPVAWVPALPTP